MRYRLHVIRRNCRKKLGGMALHQINFLLCIIKQQEHFKLINAEVESEEGPEGLALEICPKNLFLTDPNLCYTFIHLCNNTRS